MTTKQSADNYFHENKKTSREKDPKYVDDFTRFPGGQNVWHYKTIYGREIRWLVRQVKRYWPDGFPGYDHSTDPYYDDCDTHLAMKAPEW